MSNLRISKKLFSITLLTRAYQKTKCDCRIVIVLKVDNFNDLTTKSVLKKNADNKNARERQAGIILSMVILR